MDAPSIALVISGSALVLTLLNTLASLRSSHAGQLSSQVTQLEALHQAELSHLKEEAQELRVQNRRYQQHIDKCEEDLARLHSTVDQWRRDRT